MSSNVTRFQNIQQILTVIKPTFEEMAKIHGAVNYRQEASFAVEILQKNDYLAQAAMKDQDSFKRALINVAAIGLTLNPAYGLAYLIPRKGVVILDVSYKGKIALGVQCGSIKWCTAELVYEKDTFTVGASGEKPIHKYDPFDSDRGKLRGGYATAKTNADEFIISYMSLKQIEEIMKRSESVKAGSFSPWKTDFEEMVKKTLIRRNSKSWPYASTSNRERLDVAEKVEREVDPLPELVPIDPVLQSEKIEAIIYSLRILNIDETYYLAEKLPTILRREIKTFHDLTELELDQITVQLNQLVESKGKDENTKGN